MVASDLAHLDMLPCPLSRWERELCTSLLIAEEVP
jgi:hypothetical protein